MNEIKKREIPFERVLFFSDAIVAIAITLLALDLKLDIPDGQHITFADLLLPWRKYVAFILSFSNVASFWRTHHQMYNYIHKMDARSMVYNTCWLFLIVTLPFSTNVLSSHFGDSPAVFLYSLNFFGLAIFQNSIWDSADAKPDFIATDKISDEERQRFRIMFNLDMLNGLLSIILSFFIPKIAFFLLFFKVPVFFFATIYIANQRRKDVKALRENQAATTRPKKQK